MNTRRIIIKLSHPPAAAMTAGSSTPSRSSLSWQGFRHLPAMLSQPVRLATPLLGESRWAASPLAPTPALLAFTPVTLVDFFAPFTPVGWLPLRRPIGRPSSPLRRAHRVVANGNLQNRGGNVDRLHNRPRAVPRRPDVPSTIGEDPILMGVEKDVRWSLRRIVNRSSRDDHKRRRPRELNANVHAHPHLRLNGYRDGCHKQRTEHKSLHDLLHPSGWHASGPVLTFKGFVPQSAATPVSCIKSQRHHVHQAAALRLVDQLIRPQQH